MALAEAADAEAPRLVRAPDRDLYMADNLFGVGT